MLQEYEINTTILVLVATTVILAGGIYLMVNIIYAPSAKFDENSCKSLLSSVEPSVLSVALSEFSIDKHIDLSNGTNVKWKIGFLGEKQNRTFIDSIPLYEKNFFFVSSASDNKEIFEGCGARRIVAEVFSAPFHLTCKSGNEFFIASQNGTEYGFLRIGVRPLNADKFTDNILFVRNAYYQGATGKLRDALKRQVCVSA